MKKLLLFGAGKIGRSFIAQLFCNGGYEVVFIDIDQHLVNLLNIHKEYRILVKGEKEYSITVNNYRAIHFSEKEKILREFSEVPIIATSVGFGSLSELFPFLAEALIYRYSKHPFSPVDIVIAENIRNAEKLFEENLRKYLPENYPLENLVGLVETSIGKMVPIMAQKDLELDPLLIFAEEYNTLPLAARGFKNHIPEIKGLKYITNIKAWVDRKSLIHNLGHASAAYFGFQEFPEEKMLWRILLNKRIFDKTRKTMMQSANILLQKYPYNFNLTELEEHVDDLLSRFQNKALGDSMFRVGSDLYRKLDKNDRLSGAINLALNYNQPFDLILEALVSGFYFRATNESGNLLSTDIGFIAELEKLGFENMFQKVTGFSKETNPEILLKAKEIVSSIQVKR